jgi:hypothetical protein
MAKTVLTMKLKTVRELYIPPNGPQPPATLGLGDRLIFVEDVIEINGDPNLKGQHSGFAVVVREPDTWLSQAGWTLPPIPHTPLRNGGQIEARVVTKFSVSPIFVAITGGTGDFQRASGQMEIKPGNVYEATIFTP